MPAGIDAEDFMRVDSDAMRVSGLVEGVVALRAGAVFDDEATRDWEVRTDRRRGELDAEPVTTRRVFDGDFWPWAIRVGGVVATGDAIEGVVAATLSGVELSVSKLLEKLSRLADMTSRTSVLSSASTSVTGFESSEQAVTVAVKPKAAASVRRAVFIRGSVRRRVRSSIHICF